MEYLGSRSYITTTVEFYDDKYHVKHKVVQERSKDLKSWEQREAVVELEDEDMEHGLASALFSMRSYINSLNGDLFKQDDMALDTGMVS